MPRIRMSDPVSRYELNSKLAAQDARLDSAVHQMLGIVTRIDQTCGQIRAENKQLHEEIRSDMKELRAENKAMENRFDARFSSMRTTIIVTAVATALSIIFGVGSLIGTLTSTMMGIFQVVASGQQFMQKPFSEQQLTPSPPTAPSRPAIPQPQAAPPADSPHTAPPEPNR